jgi:hypothetical protein
MAQRSPSGRHAPGAILPQWLALRSTPPLPRRARSAILWGEASVASLAVRTAAIAVGHGVPVAVIDGAMAFKVTPIVAQAQARRMPPERWLRQIHVARAFTCHQLATLFCERLDPLLIARRIGLVVVLGPCSTFFDESVPFKDAFLLFQRVVRQVEALRQRGPLLLLAQALDARWQRRRLFLRALMPAVDLGVRVGREADRHRIQLVHSADAQCGRGLSPVPHSPSRR